jgi:glycine betaine/proline transport system substrate-binding protein
VWINVPEILPTEAQAPAKDRMTVSGIEGAATDPVKLGFVVSDIQIVANKEFLKKNPAAKTFMEEFTLSLNDINEQNTRMNEGEKSERDIAKHVDEWIAKNKQTWNTWLTKARNAAM